MSESSVKRDNEFQLVYYQQRILTSFIFHYLTYEGLRAKREKLKGEERFWIYTSNAHVFQCFNYWCMVFGSDKNETHWKHLSFNSDKGSGGFKKELLKELSESEWTTTWSEMTTFRNQFTAHRDTNFNKPVPYIDNAYKTVIVYMKWIKKQLPYINWPSLEDWIEEQKAVVNETVKYLIEEEF